MELKQDVLKDFFWSRCGINRTFMELKLPCVRSAYILRTY